MCVPELHPSLMHMCVKKGECFCTEISIPCNHVTFEGFWREKSVNFDLERWLIGKEFKIIQEDGCVDLVMHRCHWFCQTANKHKCFLHVMLCGRYVLLVSCKPSLSVFQCRWLRMTELASWRVMFINGSLNSTEQHRLQQKNCMENYTIHTRKHFSRIRTARLPTIGGEAPCRGDKGPGWEEGSLYSEVQVEQVSTCWGGPCMVRCNASWVMMSWDTESRS